MTKEDESRIRRDGFPITQQDAVKLLEFIDFWDKSHNTIEPAIVVRLELLAGKRCLHERKDSS